MISNHEILENSVKFRGAIINDVAILERFVDAYIANYFCATHEKVADFIDLMLGNSRINLDGKRKILYELFELLDEDIGKKMPGFTKDWNEIMRHRNIFAHNVLCVSEEALAKKKTHVGFVKFGKNSVLKRRQGKENIEWYDRDKIHEVQATIKRCISIMRDIFDESSSSAPR